MRYADFAELPETALRHAACLDTPRGALQE
jgi:hypothetical protein